MEKEIAELNQKTNQFCEDMHSIINRAKEYEVISMTLQNRLLSFICVCFAWLKVRLVKHMRTTLAEHEHNGICEATTAEESKSDYEAACGTQDCVI